MTFDYDYGWQRQFRFRLGAICGAYLFREAPWEEDAHHNTDLWLTVPKEGLRVACRVRRPEVLEHPVWRDEFTIRTSRPSGVATELEKVTAGFGDYNLYAFAGLDGGLAAWVLGDLSVFRAWRLQFLAGNGREPGDAQTNSDGSSGFRAYRIDDLPQQFVIARRWRGGLKTLEEAA